MFKHLLVPLDGSQMAEIALAPAIELARHKGVSVTLLHLVERDAPTTVHGERHLRDRDSAAEYLVAVAARFPRGSSVEGHVHEVSVEDVVAGIVAHVAEVKADVVVMSQHGRGTLSTWRLGRLPQQVAARGSVPLWLVKARGTGRAVVPWAGCRSILIPHDDVPEHTPALEVGLDLARLCGAAVHLLRVVPTRRALAAGDLLPGTTASLLEMERLAARDDLLEHLKEIRSRGIEVTAEVVRGDPVRMVLSVGLTRKADVVVLGTHALAGTRAFWEGSVGSRICARASTTVLLVPVGGRGSSGAAG